MLLSVGITVTLLSPRPCHIKTLGPKYRPDPKMAKSVTGCMEGGGREGGAGGCSAEGGRGVQRAGIPNIFLTSTFLDILGTVNHVTEVLCVRVGV